jgi:hypothetical protein
MVIPLEQTWAMIRGVPVAAPQPVSELVTTNPANTTGLSAPAAPVNGDRYPASSPGARTWTASQRARTYIRLSVRSQVSIWTGCPARRMPSKTAISVSMWSIFLYPSDSQARATPVSPSEPRRARMKNLRSSRSSRPFTFASNSAGWQSRVFRR